MKTPYECMGGTYHQEGDYLLPDLLPPKNPKIGLWGMRRWDCTATEVFSQLVERYAKQEGITEALKVQDQMEWVHRINSIRNRAEEAIYHMLIHF